MLKKMFKVLIQVFIIVYSLSFYSSVYANNIINLDLFYDGANHKYSAQEITITIEGNKITGYDVPPIVIEDRTLVPARAVFEALGAEVFWNAETKEIYITRKDDVISITVDKNIGTKNGANFTMDVPPKIINDRTFIPVRAVSEAMGCFVGWDSTTRTVSITEEEQQTNTTTPNETIPNDNTTNNNTSNNNTTSEAKTITNPNGGNVEVTSIDVPSSSSATQNFKINTSGIISKVESFVVGGDRIAVDIYGGQMSVAQSSIQVVTSSYVSAIRLAQNQLEPVKITRVVFDLKTSADYKISATGDGKSVMISFEDSQVDKVDVKAGSGKDTLTVYKGAGIIHSVENKGSNKKFEISLTGSTISDVTSPSVIGLNFIDGVAVAQTTTGVTITLTTNTSVEFSISENGSNLVVDFYKPTYQNIYYDSSRNAIVLENASGVQIESFSQTDNYLDLKYVINMGADYSGLFGYGTLAIDAGAFYGVDIKTTSGQTVLTINEANIYCYDITKEGDKVYIKAINPKQRYDKIVVIDAGHGNQDPGASGNGLTEKIINLDLALRINKLLKENTNIKVYLTREGDTYMANNKRAAMANHLGDLFVSIHQNSSTSASPNGTEVLYMNRTTDGNGKLTSKAAAQTMLDYILPALGTTNRGIKERSDLIVLNQTNGAAILIEGVFVSNPSDADKLKNETYKDNFAQAAYLAIVDILSTYPTR